MEKQIPKNVRQVGNVSDSPKVYIEDYVDTFLNQLCDKVEEEPVGAFLVGLSPAGESQDCVFISGAIQMEDIEVIGPDVAIGESVFTAAKDKRSEFFEEDEVIIGWFMIIPGIPLGVNSNIKKLHDKFFTKQNCVFIMKDSMEKDELYYVYKQQELKELSGHYIYYEKNPSMQNYMLTERKRVGLVSSEVISDQAAKDFRSIIRDRMEANTRSQSSRWTYMASTFLVLVVLIIGVTMVNNYDRMKSVQSSLDSLTKSITNEGGEAVNVSADVEGAQAAADESQLGDRPAVSEEAADAKAAPEENAEDQEASAPAKAAYESYTVEPGDTLAKISIKVYGNRERVGEICKLNEISDSNMIYVGQKLLLP